MNYLHYFNQDTGYEFNKDYIYNPWKTMKVLKWWNSYTKRYPAAHFSTMGYIILAICIGLFICGLILLLAFALSMIHPIFILIGGFIGLTMGFSLTWDFWKFSLDELSNNFSKEIFCLEYPEIVEIDDEQIIDLQKNMKDIFYKLCYYQSSHKECKELCYPFKLKCIDIVEIIKVYKQDYSSDFKMRGDIVYTLDNLISTMMKKLEEVQIGKTKEISKRLEKLRND